LRNQLDTGDDPDKQGKLQKRLETGKALREQQVRALSAFSNGDSKGNSHDRERDTDPDTGRPGNILARVGGWSPEFPETERLAIEQKWHDLAIDLAKFHGF
jgi:hypothetical protein